MLFQHFYNWIKYKTLPPSVLFKNRLYAERDSKFRRITNNLGLTFRGSKWTNYEMNNLHLKFYNSYFIVFIYVFVIVFVFITYIGFSYYSTSTIFNNVAFVLWSGLDLIDYYAGFILWSVIVFFSTFCKGLYSYFYASFANNEKNIVRLLFLDKFKNEKLFSMNDQNIISKKDYKWIASLWLQSSTSSLKSLHVETLFKPQYFESRFETVILFYCHLFKLTSLLQKSLIVSTQTNLFFVLNHQSNFNILSKKIIEQKLVLFIDANIKAFNRFYLQANKNVDFFNVTNKKWSLSSGIASFYMKYNKAAGVSLINWNNLDFRRQDSLFWTFFKNQNLINKTNVNKIHRWLYKYSLIHRRSFKNSHKITLTKKLFNVGILDKAVSSKNLWYSEFFKKFAKRNLPHLMNNVVYKFPVDEDFNGLITKLCAFPATRTELQLKNLEFYELSLFWLLKRFNFVNHLEANLVTSSWKKLPTAQLPFSTKTNSVVLRNELTPAQVFDFLAFDSPLLNAQNKTHLTTTLAKDSTLLLEKNGFFESFNTTFAASLTTELQFFNQNSVVFFHFNNLNFVLKETRGDFAEHGLNLLGHDMFSTSIFTYFTDLNSLLK